MNRVLLPYWYDGYLRNTPEFGISPVARGYLLGDGAFETLAVFNGIAIDIQAHVDRLLAASEMLGLGLSGSEVATAVSSILLAHSGVNAVMRMTVTRGGEQRGLAAQGRAIMLITMTSWVAGTLYKPVTLKTSSTRRNELSPSSRLKLTSYADNIIAAREAEAAGSGDALMLNSRGRVACSTIANLFAVLGDDIATPPVEEGALPGTIRRHVMATEQPIQPDELKKADGIFLTNSLRLVRPVQSLDGLSTSAAAGDRIMEVFAAQCLRIKEQCGIDPRAVDSTPS